MSISKITRAQQLKGNIPSANETGADLEASGDESEASSRMENNLPSDMSETDVLSFLRTDPRFAQMRSIIQQNPSQLPQMLQQLSQTNPELLSLINENAEQVFSMFDERMEDEGDAESESEGTLPWEQEADDAQTAAPTHDEIRPQEREAIDRVSI